MAKAKVAVQISPRVLAAKRNGRLGGLARAKNNSKAKIRSWSSKGGNSCLAKYGSEFFSHAQSKRKTRGRYRTPQ